MSPKQCKQHPHSSEKSAEKCYAQTKRRSADRQMKKYGAAATTVPKYLQVCHLPPVPRQLGSITVLYFYSATAL